MCDHLLIEQIAATLSYQIVVFYLMVNTVGTHEPGAHFTDWNVINSLNNLSFWKCGRKYEDNRKKIKNKRSDEWNEATVSINYAFRMLFKQLYNNIADKAEQ